MNRGTKAFADIAHPRTAMSGLKGCLVVDSPDAAASRDRGPGRARRVGVMTWWEAVLLVGGGLVAGVVNAVAGGGSTLTVPLLVLAGVPGNAANGSNRVGVLASMAASATSFRRLGVRGLRQATTVMIPVVLGSITGTVGISRLTDEAFERVFGLLMLPLVVLTMHQPQARKGQTTWSRPVTWSVFFAIGIYGGAIQAGVGLVLLAALTRAGLDVVSANNVKVLVVFVVTLVALPVFIADGRVDWIPALVLAAGFTAGGWFGAHVAVRGGERVVRVFLVIAAVGLAGRLLGLYG